MFMTIPETRSVVEQPTGQSKPFFSLWSRFQQRLPILESVLGALVLDAIDITDVPLVSWGYGIPASLVIGFWLGSLFKLPLMSRLGTAMLAAIYFVIPGTEALPLATIAVTAARFAGVGGIASSIANRRGSPAK